MKFNQLCIDSYVANKGEKTINEDGSTTITPTTSTSTASAKSTRGTNYLSENKTHKYFASVSVKITGSGNLTFGAVAYDGSSLNGFRKYISGTTNYTTTSFINTVDWNSNYIFGIVARSGSVPTDFTIKEIMCIDLTNIFGAGNEPTTVAEFENWLEANIGLKDYYDYDAGSIRNVNIEGIKTTGFNQYNPTTSKASVIRNKDYQITGTYTSIAYSDGTTITPDEDGIFTANKSDELTITGGDTDTCIHFVHSGSRNDEYESYWDYSTGLDVTHIYGKLNGEGSLVQVWPTGMPKVNDVVDRLCIENGAVVAKRFIGEQSITGAIGDEITLTGCDTSVTTFLCASDIGTLSDGVLTLTAAATNVVVYYQLATPQVYTDLVYQGSSIFADGTPVTLPIIYQADDYGTEEVIVANNTVTAPASFNIRYGINAADTIKNLPHNYVSAVGE